MIYITPEIILNENELQEEFIRASGPGGQNVNKVSTAVQLRFDAKNSPSLSEDVRERLFRLAGKRISKEGLLIIGARQFRTQERNRREARDRLAELIRKATERPKKRHKTKPGLAATKRRLTNKHHRSEIKSLRRQVESSDE
ncbi:MAG: alternative ribosome rescue aminoacyl-tRNA hydrolase ArfB [bacterium]